MPLYILPLFRRTIRIIKADYYILLPSVGMFLLIDFIGTVSPFQAAHVNAQSFPGNLPPELIVFVTVVALLFLFMQTSIVAMGENVLTDGFLSLRQSALTGILKFFPVCAATLLVALPASALVYVLSAVLHVSFLADFVSLAVSVIYTLIPVVMIHDNLGVLRSIYKLLIFIKMKTRQFIMFSLVFLSTMLFLVILAIGASSIPVVGPSLLFATIMGCATVFLMLFALVFYVEQNEIRC